MCIYILTTRLYKLPNAINLQIIKRKTINNLLSNKAFWGSNRLGVALYSLRALMLPLFHVFIKIHILISIVIYFGNEYGNLTN